MLAEILTGLVAVCATTLTAFIADALANFIKWLIARNRSSQSQIVLEIKKPGSEAKLHISISEEMTPDEADSIAQAIREFARQEQRPPEPSN